MQIRLLREGDKCSFRKLCYILVTLAMICTLCVLSVSAEGDSCGDGLTWAYDEETTTLTVTGSGAMVDYESAFAVPWMDYSTAIRTVELPDGLTTISNYAFSGCENLAEVTIPASVTAIGQEAFYGCSALESISFLGINPPSSLGEDAFYNCVSLTTVYVPVGAGNAYADALTEYIVTIEDNIPVTSNTCGENLTWVYDNGTLTIKGEGAMEDYTEGTAPWNGKVVNITTVTIEDGVTTVGSYAFSSCSNLETVTLPAGVTTIGENAFSNCSNLETVTLPAGVMTIGENAFSSCSNLETVTLPAGVTTIGENAFSSCSKLTAISIPATVTTIGAYAFYGCSNLETVTFLGNNVATFGGNVFWGCSKLTSIIVPCNNNNSYKTGVMSAYADKIVQPAHVDTNLADGICDVCGVALKGTCGINGDHMTWAYNPATYTLTVSGSGEMAWYNSHLPPWNALKGEMKTVTIESGVGKVGYAAFQNCTALTEVNLPESLTTISPSAFQGCTALTAVTIPKNVNNIHANAFLGCSMLKSVTFCCESSMNIFATDAFADCADNLVFYVPCKFPSIAKLEGYNKTIQVAPHVDENNDGACDKCSDPVTEGYCGGDADGKNLTWVFANGTLTVSGSGTMADYSSDSLPTWNKNQNSITKVIIEGGVTNVGAYAFNDYTKITEVTLPEGITTIGEKAFYYCSALTGITLPTSVITIGERAFYHCSKLTEVCLPENLTTVGSYAFYNCDALKNVTFLGNNVSQMGEYALHLYILSSIKIPCNNTNYKRDVMSAYAEKIYALHVDTAPADGLCDVCGISLTAKSGSCGEGLTWTYDDTAKTVTISGTGAMTDYGETPAPWSAYRTEITTVTVGDGVTAIGKYAFYDCSALKNVSFQKVNAPSMGEYAFSCCNNALVFSLVCNASDDYNTALAGYGKTVQKAKHVDGGEQDGLCDNCSTSMCSGTCGENLTWTYNVSSHTLTISGTGEMYDYNIYNTLVPWEAYEASIKTVEVAEGVTSIGDRAFYKCSALTKVIFLGNNITKTGNQMFSVSASLTIEVPCNNITYASNVMGEYAGMISVRPHVDDGNGNCNSCGISLNASSGSCGDGLTWAYADGTLTVSYTTGTGAMTDYGTSANLAPWFVHRANITKVVLPEGLTTVGSYAFLGCSSLTEVTLPASVTTIGAGAFATCASPFCATLRGNAVTSVGENAFHGNTMIYIPCAGNTYTSGVLQDYQPIAYHKNNDGDTVCDTCGTAAGGSCGAEGSTVNWAVSDGTLTVSGSGAMAGYDGFEGESAPWCTFAFQKAVIGKDVTTVSMGAFSTCMGLETVEFADGSALETIGEYAFYGCSLTSIALPAGVKTIGGCAFLYCPKLESVTFEGSEVTSFGDGAFVYCATNLTFNLPCNAPDSYTEELSVYGKTIKLPHVDTDPADGFCDVCGTPDENHGYCGDTTVNNGKNLIWAYDPTTFTLTVSGSGAMADYGYYVTDGTAPWYDKVANITTVVIGKDVTTIGMYAFAGCSNLETVEFADGSALETIGEGAFGDCTKLATITLPDKVTNIDRNAFGDCIALTTVNLPASITEIGIGAFAGCSALTKVTVPANVTKIGVGAFGNCSTLATVTFLGNAVTTFGTDVFTNCADGLVIYVPCGNTTYKTGVMSAYATKISPVPHVDTDPADGFCDVCGTPDENHGYCGDTTVNNGKNLIWAYDPTTFTLTVSGSGAMADYDYDENTVPWSAYTATITTVNLPAGLTTVGSWAFCGCSALTSIEIPASVTTIGDYAFVECKDLTNVAFGENSELTAIGECAFDGCTKLKAITVPAKVTSVGISAFNGCTALENVTLPDSVTEIIMGAFANCTKLTAITIPANVTAIGVGAFGNCSTLATVTFLGNAVTTFGTDVFMNCADGLVIYVPCGNTTYKTGVMSAYATKISPVPHVDTDPADGFCDVCGTPDENHGYCGDTTVNNGKNLIWAYDPTTFTLTVSGSGAMTDYDYDTSVYCSTAPWAAMGVQSVVIGKDVTTVGDYAFVECKDLTNVKFGENSELTAIGEGAFCECNKLATITVPVNVVEIGEGAFENCSSLATVTFCGNAVTTFGEYVFDGCADDLVIYIPCGNTTYKTNVMSDYYFIISPIPHIDTDPEDDKCDVCQMALVGNCGNNLTWKYNPVTCTLTFSGSGAMTEYDYDEDTYYSTAPWIAMGVQNVVIGKDVETIGKCAFWFCDTLTSVTFEENSKLETIGEGAFCYCVKLTAISIPASVETIGKAAFAPCSTLSNVTFAENSQLKTIGDGAFYNCPLTEITLPAGVTEIGMSAFEGCPLTSVTIPASVKTIGNKIFHECESLQTVTFAAGSQLKTIGDGAFYGCSLTEITLPAGVKTIGKQAFACCPLRSIAIPTGVTTLGEGVFASCNVLETIEIPAGVTTIGARTFSNCDALVAVEIPEKVTALGEGAFSYCDKLTSVTFAGTSALTTIGEQAFYYCDVLPSIEIPAGVKTIGKQAFAYCKQMTAVTFAGMSALETVGEEAFSNCLALTTVTLPAGVTTVNQEAFKNCSELTTATFLGNAVTTFNCGSNNAFAPFENCSKLTSIIVPCSNNDSYKNGVMSLYAAKIVQPDHVDTAPADGFCDVCGTSDENHGYCGDTAVNNGKNLTWAYDTTTKTLTISGTGAMENYTSTAFAPWKTLGIKKAVIESGVTTVGDGAFVMCPNLATVTLPASVETIGMSAFGYCPLTEITIPASVITIGNGAFAGCEYLEEITLPASVTTINANVFYDCRNLATVTFLGNAVTTFGTDVFMDCADGLVIYVPCNNKNSYKTGVMQDYATIISQPEHVDTNPKDNTCDTCGVCFGTCGTTLTWEYNPTTKTLTISGTGAMADYSWGSLAVVPWKDYVIENVILGDGITTIGNYAFEKCTALTEITIPASVTAIGGYAFFMSNLGSALQTVTFADQSQLQTIGEFAFYGCNQLQSIIIPAGVTKIDSCAFNECRNLTCVELLGNDTVLGNGDYTDEVFLYCPNSFVIKVSCNNTRYNGTKYADKIVYRPHVDGDNDNTCDNCRHLLKGTCGGTDNEQNVTWEINPNGNVLTISGIGTMADYAYDDTNDCSTAPWAGLNIQKAVIGNGITNIGKYAFYGFTALKTVEIPAGVTTIGESAFFNSTALTKVTIPASVKTLGASAFEECSALKTVTFADHSALETVSDYAFAGCSLTKITLPADVTTIGEYAFYKCISLTEITLPASVTTVGASAFADCSDLGTVNFLGNAVTSVGDMAFEGCSEFLSIIIPCNNTTYETVVLSAYADTIVYNDHVDTDPADGLCDVCDKSLMVESGSCGDGLTWGYNDTTYTLIISYTGTGTGVMNNYPYTYEDNCYLSTAPWAGYIVDIGEIVIGEGVTTIGEGAFAGHGDLETITIPASVTTIGTGAFAGCWYLETVIFQNIIPPAFGADVFKDCDNESLTFRLPCNASDDYKTALNMYGTVGKVAHVDEADPSGKCDVCGTDMSSCGKGLTWAYDSTTTTLTVSYTGTGTGKMDDYFYDDDTDISTAPWAAYTEDITKVIIGDGVTSIGSYAFAECSLTEITLPAGVETIGDYAFTECSLTEITLPASVTTIGDYAFAYCSSLNSIILPAGVETIGDWAVYYCTSLKNVTIPASVTTIGDGAFYKCQSLETVTFAEDSQLETIGDGAFAYCSALTAIEIPASVTVLGNNEAEYGVFKACAALKTVTFAEGSQLKTVGYYAFCGCTALETIEIPAGVTTVGAGAFAECPLTEITLPASVTTIGACAFYGCSELTTATFLGNNVTYFGSVVFEDCSALTSIIVPCNNNDSYKNGVMSAYADEISTTAFSHTDSDNNGICEICYECLFSLSATVSTKGELVLNFKIKGLDRKCVDGYTVSTDGVNFVALSSLTPTDGKYVLSVSVPAKEMGRQITLTIQYNGTTVKTLEYSVQAYYQYILNNAGNYSAEMYNVAYTALNYGAAAQIFFDYDTENLVNANLPATPDGYTAPEDKANLAMALGYADGNKPERKTVGSVDNLTLAGKDLGCSLLLEGTVSLRLYFEYTGDIKTLSAKYGETVVTPVLVSGNRYYVQTAGISAKNLADTVTFTFTAGGQTATVEYSPMVYIYNMYANEDADLVTLCKAMYLYYKAALAYANS